MAASSRAQVLDLYRAMLRESKRFGAYNYRTYAIRRIRDAFRENKNVKDPAEIQALVNKARRDLGIIRRQIFTGSYWLNKNLRSKEAPGLTCPQVQSQLTHQGLFRSQVHGPRRASATSSEYPEQPGALLPWGAELRKLQSREAFLNGVSRKT
ncbi:hypothetical protein CapIbe_019868 [Capra ibex]